MTPLAIAALAFFAGIFTLGLAVFFSMLYLEIRKGNRNSALLTTQINTLTVTLGGYSKLMQEVLDSNSRSNTAVAQAIAGVSLANTKAAEKVASSNEKAAAQIVGSYDKATGVFNEVIAQVKLLKESFDVFIKMMYPVAAVPGDETRPPVQQAGEFIPYDERRMASEEAFTEARKHGVELDETRLFTPETAQMRGPHVDEGAKSSEPETRGPVSPAQDPGITP